MICKNTQTTTKSLKNQVHLFFFLSTSWKRMDTSIPQHLHDEWQPSPNDLELKDKVIAVIFVAMRHRDYVYKVVCYTFSSLSHIFLFTF